VQLSELEATVLATAWRGGVAPAALRQRAANRRQRAELARSVLAGLRYPLVLFALLVAMGLATASITGTVLLPVVVLGLGAAVATFGWFARRAAKRGDRWLSAVPGLGRLWQEAGELPYLETLHALYGAGVPLKTAHQAAVAAVGVGSVAARLAIADRVLQEGRPLADGLAQGLALHHETRQLLTTGEVAGKLEDALLRALVRRREVVGRDAALFCRRLGQVTYALAATAVLLTVVQFYTSYFGMLRR
jgi:type II secretory pathway component PulF